MKEQHEPLIGSSAAIRAVRKEMQYAARSNAKVLLTGKSGAGKDVVARLIHFHRRRAMAAFVPMSCAGVPGELTGAAPTSFGCKTLAVCSEFTGFQMAKL